MKFFNHDPLGRPAPLLYIPTNEKVHDSTLQRPHHEQMSYDHLIILSSSPNSLAATMGGFDDLWDCSSSPDWSSSMMADATRQEHINCVRDAILYLVEPCNSTAYLDAASTRYLPSEQAYRVKTANVENIHMLHSVSSHHVLRT